MFDGQFKHMIHATQEDGILKWLVKYDSNLILMHHRFPTSTINVKKAAHPFSTKKYFGKTQYILVHNGAIRNSHELFEKHQELGIEYHSLLQDMTFNDSESLLWDFALYMEGKQQDLKVEGGIAFICLKLVKGKLEKLYFGRNDCNPLNMFRDKEGIMLSSVGKGESIDINQLHTWDYQRKRLTKRYLQIPGYSYTPTRRIYKPVTSSYPNSGFSSGEASSSYTPSSYAAEGHYHMWIDQDCAACLEWNYPCDYHYSEMIEAEDRDRMASAKNILAKQFPKLYNKMMKDPVIPRKKEPIEYIQDPDTQKMVPASTLSDQLSLEEQRRTTDDISEAEVATEYLAYLASCKGHFESTYWLIEWDYENLGKAKVSKDNIRKLRVIEKVMERIETDPEYVDDKAVSSTWGKRWAS